MKDAAKANPAALVRVNMMVMVDGLPVFPPGHERRRHQFHPPAFPSPISPSEPAGFALQERDPADSDPHAACQPMGIRQV